MISFLLNGIQAEFLKVKRSQVLLVAIFIPLFPVGLSFGRVLQIGLSNIYDKDVLAPWSIYFRGSIDVWTIFALPFIVAIISSLLANVDHKTHQWKMLHALAFPRAGVFAGKWMVLMALTLLSVIVFSLGSIIAGLVAGLLHPELGLDWPVPLVDAFGRPLLAWLLSALMITIHLWISLRWSSFLVSILSGFFAVVLNIFMIGSFMNTYAAWSPWSLPSMVYPSVLPQYLVYSLAAMLVVYLLANAQFVRRDVL